MANKKMAETLDCSALQPRQVDLLVESLATFTEHEPETIRRCEYSNEELVDLFNRATSYHNAYVEHRRRVMSVGESNDIRTGGQYSRGSRVHDYAAKALKHKIDADHYEQSMTRLAQSIATRAVLKATGPK